MKLGPFPTNAPWNSTSIQAWLDRLRTIYSTAYENLQDHIGLGGTAQHPLTNVTTAGFAPATGTPSGKFLRDDVTWADPSTVGSSTDVFVLSGDQATAADTNPISLTDLTWDFEANAVYTFKFIGNVSPTASTSGCGFQLLVT